MNNSVNKHQLASKMAKKTGVLKKDCERLIDAMVEEMVAQAKSGGGVYVRNFGKFEYYVRGTDRRRIPETGEWIEVPPVTRIKFIPCKDVKYGVAALDWEPYLSEYQQTEAEWYKKVLKEREESSDLQ